MRISPVRLVNAWLTYMEDIPRAETLMPYKNHLDFQVKICDIDIDDQLCPHNHLVCVTKYAFVAFGK